MKAEVFVYLPDTPSPYRRNRKDPMNKSSLLSQLAIAGIAAGLISAAPVRAEDGMMADTTKAAAPSKKKHKKARKAMADSSKMGMNSMGTAGLTMANDKHSCKGQNSCKGLGGCKTSAEELKARAEKMGMAMDKAGSAHSCKTKNECKGLGGCANS